MPKYNVTTSTGAEAAAAAGRLVSIVASTSTPTPDMVGLDLHCQLLERPHLPFGVQAKGSASPRHSATTIDSDAVDCTTIRDWLELPFPVFIFMTDTISDRTYYVRATADLLARTATGQRAVTPQVPLRNRLTRENIGLLVIEVLCNQRIDQAKIERYRDAYKDAHPDQLFDPMDTDAQLELMRGSDQSAQLALVASLREQREHGQHIPHSLCEDLVGSLNSCKERVTRIRDGCHRCSRLQAGSARTRQASPPQRPVARIPVDASRVGVQPLRFPLSGSCWIRLAISGSCLEQAHRAQRPCAAVRSDPSLRRSSCPGKFPPRPTHPRGA